MTVLIFTALVLPALTSSSPGVPKPKHTIKQVKE